MNIHPTILVVDDEENTRRGLKSFLEMHEYEVSLAKDAYEALDVIKMDNPDIVLTDVRMPEINGLQLLAKIKEISPETIVIMVTAYGSVEDAVKAIQSGAYHYLSKPINTDELIEILKKAVSRKRLEQENKDLKVQLDEKYEFGKIVYTSKKMQDIIDTVEQVAPTNASVLIEGESGTGKELIARLIHARSARKNEAIVPVHCASLTDTLLASELFGHEKGAYTGAFERKIGRFEKAHKGTLFLDEIGEVKEDMQVKLLRVLQEGEFERVGGTKTIKVDIRLISASNKNLKDEIKSGRFREDLFYRINVVSIPLPPLRERREDIEALVEYYIRHYSSVNHKKITGISNEALKALIDYNWPGNVREVRNVVERMVVLARGDSLDISNVPADIRDFSMRSIVSDQSGGSQHSHASIRDMEKDMIERTLKEMNGNKSKVAKKLGISRRTLYRKIDDFKIKDTP
jgi:two-component system, NtrC family, response regulator AtoC